MGGAFAVWLLLLDCVHMWPVTTNWPISRNFKYTSYWYFWILQIKRFPMVYNTWGNNNPPSRQSLWKKESSHLSNEKYLTLTGCTGKWHIATYSSFRHDRSHISKLKTWLFIYFVIFDLISTLQLNVGHVDGVETESVSTSDVTSYSGGSSQPASCTRDVFLIRQQSHVMMTTSPDQSSESNYLLSSFYADILNSLADQLIAFCFNRT